MKGHLRPAWLAAQATAAVVARVVDSVRMDVVECEQSAVITERLQHLKVKEVQMRGFVTTWQVICPAS